MVSRRKILSRSRDDLTLGEERTKHTQVDDGYHGDSDSDSHSHSDDHDEHDDHDKLKGKLIGR